MLFRKLSESQNKILRALARGETLKAHRNLDGEKVYHFHPLDGQSYDVAEHDVHILHERKLLYTNHKFPANTYLLTDAGRAIASKLTKNEVLVLGARND